MEQTIKSAAGSLACFSLQHSDYNNIFSNIISILAMVRLPNTFIELAQPYGDRSPITKYCSRNKKGALHHLCFEVDNLSGAVEWCSENEVRVISGPKMGPHGKQHVFLLPDDCAGVLIELQET